MILGPFWELSCILQGCFIRIVAGSFCLLVFVVFIIFGGYCTQYEKTEDLRIQLTQTRNELAKKIGYTKLTDDPEILPIQTPTPSHLKPVYIDVAPGAPDCHPTVSIIK